MNNKEVKKQLEECGNELETIAKLLLGLGDEAKPSPYVKKYAVIRATGSIESGFKRVIADRVDHGSHDQLKNFIAKKIRQSSKNPRLSAIQEMLGEFDSQWRKHFDEKISLLNKSSINTALAELVDARNSFAHGGGAVLQIDKTIEFYALACQAINVLDETVHAIYDQTGKDNE